MSALREIVLRSVGLQRIYGGEQSISIKSEYSTVQTGREGLAPCIETSNPFKFEQPVNIFIMEDVPTQFPFVNRRKIQRDHQSAQLL
jgi:hypothetical protein